MLLTAVLSTMFWKTTFRVACPWSQTRCSSCKELTVLHMAMALFGVTIISLVLLSWSQNFKKKKSKQSLSLAWCTSLTRWPGQQSPGMHLSVFPQGWGYKCTPLYLVVPQNVSSRGINSGPYIVWQAFLLSHLPRFQGSLMRWVSTRSSESILLLVE